ncbi:hypothetical protein D8I24_6526 [Cupriavidus necator H850]|uniref:hypothetical protein n=1 Tax=Cupriavidus necator TaxID=106590 RepID=UPI00129DB1DB|nr:hypothetical protein [Cupriavidus necator]KAI3597710.1 hypothetical protein D8I24_6526 [Cupriavidus necator H850]
MTTTLRESYAEQMRAALEAVPALQALGMRFSRSIFEALEMRATKYVLVLHHGADAPGHETTGAVDRHSELLVTLVVRDTDPDPLSEAALAIVHPVVMAFTAAQLIDVSELSTDAPAYDHTGGMRSARTVHYDLFYRTQRGSLSA